MKAVSIVVPTLNEAENIPVLVHRIAASFRRSGIRYEIVFIDDHSTDGTTGVIESLVQKYPIRLQIKIGSRGKAYSLLQGFRLARYDIICMIDADLQYPPEAILPMYELLQATGTDIVLTERQDDETTSRFRQFSSKVFNLVFTRLLFGFNYDSQSGLKLFRKEVIQKIALNPTPWSFDLEFIVRALENNYKIISYKIPFSKRYSGEAKVRMLRVAYELAAASIKLRLNSSHRKIKQAYATNLKTAERITGLFVVLLAGILSGLSLAQPAAIRAQLQGSSTSQIETVPTVTTQPLQNILLPADTQPQPIANDTTAIPGGQIKPSGSRQTTSGAASVSSGAVQNRSAMPGLTNTTQSTETTYPLNYAAPTSVYPSASAPLPIDIVRLWIASLVGVLALTATYITLASYSRGNFKHPLKENAHA